MAKKVAFHTECFWVKKALIISLFSSIFCIFLCSQRFSFLYPSTVMWNTVVCPPRKLLSVLFNPTSSWKLILRKVWRDFVYLHLRTYWQINSLKTKPNRIIGKTKIKFVCWIQLGSKEKTKTILQWIPVGEVVEQWLFHSKTMSNWGKKIAYKFECQF